MGFAGELSCFLMIGARERLGEKQKQKWLLNMDLFELCSITSVEVGASLDFLCMNDSHVC